MVDLQKWDPELPNDVSPRVSVSLVDNGKQNLSRWTCIVRCGDARFVSSGPTAVKARKPAVQKARQWVGETKSALGELLSGGLVP